MRILVADDEPNTRDALAEVLREEGHQVTTVSGGRLAVESLGSVPCDLVITDLNMPDVNGLEVIDAAQAAQPDAAIVVITAYGERYRRSFVERCDVALLSKPFRLNEILAVVAGVAERRAERKDAAAPMAVAGVVRDSGETAERI